MALGKRTGWMMELAVMGRWSRLPNSSGKQYHSVSSTRSTFSVV